MIKHFVCTSNFTIISIRPEFELQLAELVLLLVPITTVYRILIIGLHQHITLHV